MNHRILRSAGAISLCVFTSNSPARMPPRPVPTGETQPPDTLLRLNRCLTVTFSDTRLEDALTWFRESTSLKIEPFWLDDRHSEGLDRDRLITVHAENESALTLLERILEAAHSDSGGDATWQLTSSGAVQLGPRSRLNAFKRIQIYAIDHLVREVPNYTEHPTIDLQQALQTGRGAGSNSPIRENPGGEVPSTAQSVKEGNTLDLVSLIRDLIEPEQWNENGGTGGTIRLYRGALIINAPDYIHRAIGGYLHAAVAQRSQR